MEWLPNNSGAKFSFLVTKVKSKPPSSSNVQIKPPSTPAPKAAQSPAGFGTNAPNPAGLANNTTTPGAVPLYLATPGSMQATPITPAGATPGAPTVPFTTPLQQATPYVPPPRIEDFDEKNDVKDIEFYQPVTVLVMSGHPDILQTLPRAIRPPDVVEKYMNQVFDTCRRADETFLAFRLPKEGGTEVDNEEKRLKSGDATPKVNGGVDSDVLMGGTSIDRKKTTGRTRKSIAV